MSDYSQFQEITETPQGTTSGAVGAFLRSMGRETTAGLTDYPAALGIMASRAMSRDARKLSYEEALREVREQGQQLKTLYPTASTAGQITGGIVGSAGPGGGIPAVVGRSAVLGGVSGFTGKEGMENVGADVLGGAALGATTGLVAGGLGKLGGAAQEKLVRNVYIDNQKSFQAARTQAYNEGMSALQPTIDRVLSKTSSINPIPADKIVQDIAKKKVNVPTTREEVELAKSVYNNRRLAQQAANRAKTAETATGDELYDLAKKSMQYSATRGAQSFVGLAKETLPTIAAGAAMGAGVGSLTGMDPTRAAALGAGLGGLYQVKQAAAPLITKTVGALAARGPYVGAAPETIGRGVIKTALAPEFGPYDYSTFEPVTDMTPTAPVEDNRSRLQRLADEARARFQGLQ